MESTATVDGKFSPLALRVSELEQRLGSIHNSIVLALNHLLDLKDINTGLHSTRLAEWAVRVAQDCHVPDEWLYDVEVAALLHDVGKVGIPDHILKKPAPLTQDEFAVMKRHPEYGWAVVRLFPELERASLYILHHHEAFDGTGYPAGLAGEDIPIGARIVAVIDAYDAMISQRPYRRGLGERESRRRLSAAAGKQFDPAVVDSFLRNVAKQ